MPLSNENGAVVEDVIPKLISYDSYVYTHQTELNKSSEKVRQVSTKMFVVFVLTDYCAKAKFEKKIA